MNVLAGKTFVQWKNQPEISHLFGWAHRICRVLLVTLNQMPSARFRHHGWFQKALNLAGWPAPQGREIL